MPSPARRPHAIEGLGRGFASDQGRAGRSTRQKLQQGIARNEDSSSGTMGTQLAGADPVPNTGD